MYKVYIITNTSNGKYYVGQTKLTLRKRWSGHRRRAEEGSNTHLSAAIRMYGKDAFTMEQIGSVGTHGEANNLERLWIILLDCCNPQLGYNLTYGGEGGIKTPKVIEEHRRRLKGRKSSPEARARISKGLQEAWASGLMTGTRGKKMPLSMSEATRRRLQTNHPMFRHDIPTDQIVNMRLSGMFIREIADALNISVSMVERRCKKSGIEFPTVHRDQSEETRLKRSMASKGRVVSPETREKIRRIVTENWNLRKQNDITGSTI